jgi:hypothetical protein
VTTILLTFENDDEKTLFLKVLDNLAKTEADPEAKIVEKAIKTVIHDPVTQQLHSLWVGGQKIVEGTLKDLNERFEQEVLQHKANMQIKEKRGEGWKVIRQRAFQRAN